MKGGFSFFRFVDFSLVYVLVLLAVLLVREFWSKAEEPRTSSLVCGGSANASINLYYGVRAC